MTELLQIRHNTTFVIDDNGEKISPQYELVFLAAQKEYGLNISPSGQPMLSESFKMLEFRGVASENRLDEMIETLQTIKAKANKLAQKIIE
jgi:hypothetical protein